MEPEFRYVNAFSKVRRSSDQTFVLNIFAADEDIQFPPHIVWNFSFFTTTDLYFIDRQDNCVHIHPKREGNKYWIKASDIGRIRALYRPTPLLFVELSYVAWGMFYMLAWDNTLTKEKPRAVDEIYASNVLPDQIIQWLADRCKVHFNKEAQLAAFETERLIHLQRRMQQGPPPRSQESRINLHQQGGGAVAGPSRRYRRDSSSESSKSSVNQRTPSS